MAFSLTKQSIETMSYQDLRKQCKKAGLRAIGKTAILKQRLLTVIVVDKQPSPEKTARVKDLLCPISCEFPFDPVVAEDTQLLPTVVAVEQPSLKLTVCVKDLLCPITKELPFDPVTAQDGYVYERWAIESHLENYPYGDDLKSPTTNEPMGRWLSPASHIRSYIQKLMDAGLVDDEELVDVWNQKVQVEKDMAQVKEDMAFFLKKADVSDDMVFAIRNTIAALKDEMIANN